MACQPVATSGAAPASVAAADISACLPESVGRDFLVTKDQREVCRLSPWGDVAPGLTRGSTPIRPITERLSLAPSSSTRRLLGFSCESLSQRVVPLGRRRAYHVPPLS